MAHAALAYAPQAPFVAHASQATSIRETPSAPQSQDYFDDTRCYRKTVAGHFEVVHRSQALRPELRRLLILIDGHHRVEDLSPYFRGGELSCLCDELRAFGLIESIAAKSSFCRPIITEAVALTPSDSEARCVAVRAMATHVLRELLGDDAPRWIAPLAARRDPIALRTEVGLIAAKLQARLGEDAVTIFLECIREAASSTIH